MASSLYRKVFADLSIRWKCAMVLLLTAGLALFIANAALAAIQWFAARNQMVDQLHAEAKIIAANAADPLLSGNRRDAEHILRAVEPLEDITIAILHDGVGMPFATYVRPGTSTPAQMANFLPCWYIPPASAHRSLAFQLCV